MSVHERLSRLGITIPDPVTPVTPLYIPVVRHQSLVFISGQLPMEGGKVLYKGRVGIDLPLEGGQAAARLCILNVLACVKAACDQDLERVERCLKIEGFVCAASDFEDHPKVINPASELVMELFQDRGRHTRTALGVASLPLGSAVEISAFFALKS